MRQRRQAFPAKRALHGGAEEDQPRQLAGPGSRRLTHLLCERFTVSHTFNFYFNLSLMTSWFHHFFATLLPECVARVPVSLWGSGGWGCVRSTLLNRSQAVRNRSQPTSTVRNRLHETRMAVPMASSAKGSLLGFQTSRSFVSRGRCGTLWHSGMFHNVTKIVLCGKCNMFATLSDDELHFSWHVQHFGGLHRQFAWQAQHFRRVGLPVFCESQCQGCVKWWQRANSVAGVTFCEMGWEVTEASHETSILR